MYRIKYRLTDPVIHKGFMMIADGLGGRSRFKHALDYFNQNGFPKMKYANLYQTYHHALKRSKPLRIAENKYQNKVNQDRKLRHKHKLAYQRDRRLAKKHLYTQALDNIQLLKQHISRLKDDNNRDKIIIDNKNNQIKQLTAMNRQLNNQLAMFKYHNGQVTNNMGQNGYYNQNQQQRTRITPQNNPNLNQQRTNPNQNKPLWSN